MKISDPFPPNCTAKTSPIDLKGARIPQDPIRQLAWAKYFYLTGIVVSDQTAVAVAGLSQETQINLIRLLIAEGPKRSSGG